jgi:hypothetical protein
MNAKYNINVCQHFYARHRVRLLFPDLPCVIEHFTRGEDRFYPLEMLKFVDQPFEPATNEWLDNMFKEISAIDTTIKHKKREIEEEEAAKQSDDGDIDYARSECSQKLCTCCDPPVIHYCWHPYPY